MYVCLPVVNAAVGLGKGGLAADMTLHCLWFWFLTSDGDMSRWDN